MRNQFTYQYDHAHFEMVYHPQGHGTTTVHGGTPVSFSEGSVVIYPPYLRHDQRVTLPAIDICILFSVVGPIPQALAGWRCILNVKDSFITGELMAFANPLPTMLPQEQLLLNFRLTTVVAGLLQLPAQTALAANTGDTADYAGKAQHYLRENYRTTTSLKSAAAALGIGEDYLRHEFKRKFKISPKQYLLNLRIDQACKLLAHSSLPLKAVAQLCGFENDRYFCTCFKAREGLTPGEYRRKA